MQHAIAVVMLIDDLMMDGGVDLERSDVLKLVLARERYPCLHMLRRRRETTDFGMVGKLEIALAVGRRRIARRARNIVANENDNVNAMSKLADRNRIAPF